jgi:catechol 2,3-dioxygenase
LIGRLGHVSLTVDDLASAREFYVGVLGFDEHAYEGGRLLLRAAAEFDLWSLALVEGEGPGLDHLAFRVASDEALTQLEDIHIRLGLPCERVPEGTEPGQGEALRVLTASGHPVEFYHRFDEVGGGTGAALHRALRSTHLRRGIPPARLDHVNLRVPEVEDALEYWTENLDFSASEYWLEPDGSVRVAWLRRAFGTHDVAVGTDEVAGMHHVAYTLTDEAALIRAADVVSDAGLQAALEYGPSRHGATNACCLYLRDPSGNRIEFYAGDYVRDLDRPPIRWSAEEYAARGHSWWGQPAGESFRNATPVNLGDWPGAGTRVM